MVAEVLRVSKEAADAPRVVFVFQSEPEEGRAFFARYDGAEHAIADPDRELYRAFGLDRGTLGQLAGPRVWLAGIRAVGKGHGMGRVRGDAFQMPGAFLVEDGEVTWSHEFRHAGDAPDFSRVLR